MVIVSGSKESDDEEPCTKGQSWSSILNKGLCVRGT